MFNLLLKKDSLTPPPFLVATYKGREIIETPPQLALRYMEEKIAYFGNVVSLHFILCFAMWCMTPKTGKKRNISTSLKVNNI